MMAPVSQIKIYGYADHLRPRRDRLSDVLHGCVMDAFAYPAGKRAHRFFYLEPGDFRAPDGRTHDYVILEFALFEGRTIEAKKHLYRLIFERFDADLGITPMDVEITLTETPRHDWAMRGMAGDEVDLNYRVEV